MEKLEIESEDDLFAALERVISDEVAEQDWEVEFKGWPRFEITIRGESFDGGVPTRIMPPLLDLQKKIDSAYARLKYGRSDKRLSADERSKTELVVHLKPGSTTFSSDVWTILNNMGQQAVGKMNGTEALIALLGTAAIVGGVWAFKAYLNQRLAEKELDHRVDMSREETRRGEILQRAAARSDNLQEQINGLNEDLDEFRGKLLKGLKPEDELVLDDKPVIDGETAKKAIRRERVEAVESRHDGRFMILTVESGGVRGGFRLRVRDLEAEGELTVKVPEGTLAEEQIKTLQKGEWGKQPLLMKLNVKKRGARIIEATLIEAGLDEAE